LLAFAFILGGFAVFAIQRGTSSEVK